MVLLVLLDRFPKLGGIFPLGVVSKVDLLRMLRDNLERPSYRHDTPQVAHAVRREHLLRAAEGFGPAQRVGLAHLGWRTGRWGRVRLCGIHEEDVAVVRREVQGLLELRVRPDPIEVAFDTRRLVQSRAVLQVHTRCAVFLQPQLKVRGFASLRQKVTVCSVVTPLQNQGTPV